MVPLKMHFEVEENHVFILQRLNFFIQMFLGTAVMSGHISNFVGCLVVLGLGFFSQKNLSRHSKRTHGKPCDHFDGCLILMLCRLK